MALVLPQIERRHALTGLWSDTRLAIDAILNHTAASPHTSSTRVTTSVAKCVMCVSESYDTGYKKAKDNANRVKQVCEVWPTHLQETLFGKCSLQVVQ